MIAPACANVNRVGARPRPEQHRCGLSVAWHCCDLSRATGAARTGDIGFDVWASDGTPTPRLPLQTPSAADAFRPQIRTDAGAFLLDRGGLGTRVLWAWAGE